MSLNTSDSTSCKRQPHTFSNGCSHKLPLRRVLPSFSAVVDEVFGRVSYVTPWSAGTARVPSTAYCLLFKLFLLRLTPEQIQELLDNKESAYVRALGFLYLRYGCPPKDLWTWFRPHIDDKQRFSPSSDRAVSTTMGDFVYSLITQPSFHGSILPRLPLTVKRTMALEVRGAGFPSVCLQKRTTPCSPSAACHGRR